MAVSETSGAVVRISQAHDAGQETVRARGEPRTFASGISDPLSGDESDGIRVPAFVRRSGGISIAVSDDDLHTAMSPSPTARCLVPRGPEQAPV